MTAWTCADCGLTSGPAEPGETAQLATIHDLVHHGGARTAVLHTLETV